MSLAAQALRVATLLAVDLGGLTAGVYVALVLREVYVGQVPIVWTGLWETETTWLPFLFVVTTLSFWRAGLYAPREMRPGPGAILASLALSGVLLFTIAIGSGHEFGSYGLVPLAVVLAAALIGSLRALLDAVAGRLYKLAGRRRHILLVAGPADSGRLRHTIAGARGDERVEFFDAIVGPSRESVAAAVRAIGNPAIDEVVVTDTDLLEADVLDIVAAAHRHAVRVRLAPRTTDILAQRGRFIGGHGTPLFELRPPVFIGVDWIVKRAFDVLVSAALVVLLLPLWIIIASAVKLTSPGPVFYRDRRVGLGEREFLMMKFRTMEANAAERHGELEGANEASGALFKMKRDPRITRVGAILRRFSLDELPQLAHVLRGEMSLVGPRPLPVRDHGRLEQWHRKRSLVVPGMTGLWQVSGRSDLPFDDLIRLDFYYLENWSIWLDITILLRTIPAVLSRRGAY